MSIVIYHNPRCSKSRQTLGLLRGKGIEPTIIEYLKNPPTIEQLDAILQQLGLEPRALMRKTEAVYREAGLDDPALDRAALIAAMAAHPVLIERPIVLAHGKAVIGRPPENVLTLLQA
jgi:arsenate reductase